MEYEWKIYEYYINVSYQVESPRKLDPSLLFMVLYIHNNGTLQSHIFESIEIQRPLRSLCERWKPKRITAVLDAEDAKQEAVHHEDDNSPGNYSDLLNLWV